MLNRTDIQNAARDLIGSPWHHQGRSPQSGIDCIGNLIYVGLKVGYFTPEQIKEVDVVDYSRTPDGHALLLQYLRKYWKEIPIQDSKEGDILTFRMAGKRETSHVGIKLRGEREYTIVHALEEKRTVEDSLRRWSKFITHAFEFNGIE